MVKSKNLFWSYALKFVVAIVILAGFVVAAHIVLTGSGVVRFSSVNEDAVYTYNFSVNNTDPVQTANITWVNVTLPSSFTFVFNTNGTDVFSNFTNGSSIVLMWSNDTRQLIENGSRKFFHFNASASTPGTYNISIKTTNATFTVENNLTVTVNDTTIPSSVGFVSPTEVGGANVSRGNVLINTSVTDNGNIDKILVYVYNTTAQFNLSFSTSSPFYVNVTGLSEGNYYFNATVNDTFNNLNYSETRIVLVDLTAPTVTLTKVSSGDTTIDVSASGNDTTGSGISGACTISSSSGSVSNLQVSSLACGTSYSITATCTDRAGNSGTATESFSTSGCSSSSSSSSGGGGGGSSHSWTITYANDQKELAEEGVINREMGKDYRVRIKVSKEIHYVGVLSVGSNEAKIEVS